MTYNRPLARVSTGSTAPNYPGFKIGGGGQGRVPGPGLMTFLIFSSHPCLSFSIENFKSNLIPQELCSTLQQCKQTPWQQHDIEPYYYNLEPYYCFCVPFSRTLFRFAHTVSFPCNLTDSEKNKPLNLISLNFWMEQQFHQENTRKTCGTSL